MLNHRKESCERVPARLEAALAGAGLRLRWDEHHPPCRAQKGWKQLMDLLAAEELLVLCLLEGGLGRGAQRAAASSFHVLL